MGEGDIKLLTADDLSKMVTNESINSLVGRMVFIETRPKNDVKWKIFPAFVQEERARNYRFGRSWVVAIVQRIDGSIEMVKVRIWENNIGVRYRIWEDVPYMLDLAKAGEWPELEKTATDGDKGESEHGAALQPGEDRSGEGVSGKELDAESHGDE